MKSLAALALLLAATVSVAAPLKLSTGGTLKVEGDSTLHKWSLNSTSMTAVFEMADGAPAALADAVKSGKVKRMELRIAVAGLRSGESGLDKNMRKAMNEGTFQDVVYRLERYEMGQAAADGAVTAKTAGQLTIAGQTREIVMDVSFNFPKDGPHAAGSYALNMSDYGIKPPTLMLGTIKVRDPVTIRFDLTFNKEKLP